MHVDGGSKLADRDFVRLAAYMKTNFGINLDKKKTLIEGRLGSMIHNRGFSGFEEYINHALTDPTHSEIGQLVSSLTTNFTYFYREEQHYEFLKKVVLPEWTPKIRDRDLRVWSAGCSSGEEAYTAAMLLNEYFAGVQPKWDTKILATDISDNILAIAKQGVYNKESLSRLPAAWKARYFTQHPHLSDSVLIGDEIKNEVIFGKLNLMDRVFPFRKKMHVIFCRNVMIYFDGPTKEALVRRYHDALEPGGYLFVGLSETLGNLKTDMIPVQPSIYRRGNK